MWTWVALPVSVVSGVHRFTAGCDTLCVLQVGMKDCKMAAAESVVSGIDIFMSSTGDFKMITQDHMKETKTNSSCRSPEGHDVILQAQGPRLIVGCASLTCQGIGKKPGAARTRPTFCRGSLLGRRTREGVLLLLEES